MAGTTATGLTWAFTSGVRSSRPGSTPSTLWTMAPSRTEKSMSNVSAKAVMAASSDVSTPSRSAFQVAMR